MERSPQLTELLNRIYTAVSNGDAATLSSVLSAHDGLLFIGTDPEEWFEDADSIRAMLTAQASAGIKVEGGDVVAYEEGTVGWVADRGHFLLPDGVRVPFRISAVFHRESGRWALVQEHASIAMTNDDALVVGLS